LAIATGCVEGRGIQCVITKEYSVLLVRKKTDEMKSGSFYGAELDSNFSPVNSHIYVARTADEETVDIGNVEVTLSVDGLAVLEMLSDLLIVHLFAVGLPRSHQEIDNRKKLEESEDDELDFFEQDETSD
jgi:hypothetical protein